MVHDARGIGVDRRVAGKRLRGFGAFDETHDAALARAELVENDEAVPLRQWLGGSAGELLLRQRLDDQQAATAVGGFLLREGHAADDSAEAHGGDGLGTA